MIRHLYTLALALALIAPSLGAVAGHRDEIIAIIPGQLRDEHGILFSDLRKLEPLSIYLFRGGRQEGKRIISRGDCSLFRAELSPDGSLLAYALETRESPQSPNFRQPSIQSVIVTTSEGLQVDSISGGSRLAWNGMHFAWSPSGKRLAVILTDDSGRRSGPAESLLIWDVVDGHRTGYRAGRRVWDVGWAAADTVLLVGSMTNYALATSTGVISFAQRGAAELSPDGKYSLSRGDDQAHLHVFEDSSGVEVTGGIVQQTRNNLGRARWIGGGGAGHLLAVTTCDSTGNGHGPLERRCATAFVDAAQLRCLREVPGVLVGRSAARTDVVLLRNDSLIFVAADPAWARPFPPRVKRGADSSHRRSIALEVSTEAWGSRRGRRFLGTDTLQVVVGTRFGSLEGARSTARDGTFRVARVDAANRVLVDALGIRPPGVVVGPGNVYRWQRFVLSGDPVSVSTNSSDGGVIFRLRTLPDSGAR